jgi:hypothetical protein
VTANEAHRREMTDEAWEHVLRVAANLQRIFPEAVLVGGTAAAMHANHRFSYDDDHVVANLISRFEEVLAELEAVAGWTTNRLKIPVMILGSLEGVETGVRNLIRSAPLQTEIRQTPYGPITLPTLDEMLRIKAYLVATRNAARDYLDTVALADRLEQERGVDGVWIALEPLDRLYPQSNESSILLQVAKQLAEPHPKDLGAAYLTEYRGIADRWKSWDSVLERASALATLILKKIARAEGSP